VVAGESTAQPGGPLAGLTAGSRVAGYRLEKLVGVGGMAAVFRARDERLGRVVALKLLAGDEVVRKRFVREARAVAAVDHPHIIPVYEAGEAEGVLFIAMRFVAGDDLRVVVSREGALRPRRAAAFISPVASALDAAHDAGLVHRDVKPANMLVDVGPGRPEHVYLSDFGVARGVMSSSGLTRAGPRRGPGLRWWPRTAPITTACRRSATPMPRRSRFPPSCPNGGSGSPGLRSASGGAACPATSSRRST
jgi:serine/threonine protein kinase